MNTPQRPAPAWLPDLVQQVQHGLHQMTADRHDQRPALEQELKQIEQNIQGWSISLAKPELPGALRSTIENEWGAAVERLQEIQTELQQLANAAIHAADIVRPEQVLQRLEQLGTVLAANDPTRGNLELSLHIDRITCTRDGKVSMRMCKLGIMPDTVGLLTATLPETLGNDSKNTLPLRARRRTKLRIIDEDGKVDLRAQADFIANTERFADLGEEWFWLDEFQIPESLSWAATHAEAVFQRRQESGLSYAKLAKEFGVTSPTIGAAMDHYLETHPGTKDGVVLQGGGKRPRKFDVAKHAQEARRLWEEEGWSKERLAKEYGCSLPTVDKFLGFAYAQNGESMPTREDLRRAKISEARKLFDEGKSLNSIAKTMHVSRLTAHNWVRESFEAVGQTMPDMRRKQSPQVEITKG